jgi:alkyldihydroxyacetonephosphate synthase
VDGMKELAERLGVDQVDRDPNDLRQHSHDLSPVALLDERGGSPWPEPMCVVRPRSTAQVATILAWADETKTPVVPFGGGSGVLGAIAPEGAVVVELRAMNQILELDEKSRLVRCEAGVSGPDLGQALESWGYTLGHEPQSLDISTVGGWVSTRACGQLSARYGGIEKMVAGLDAVLPGGKIARSKVVPRRATGPDVASLMIGSEGTLGIVTDVSLRVSPRVGERVDRCLRFEHMADGVAACRRLAQSDLAPTLVRLYDAEDAVLFLRNHPEQEQGPLLLLSFDGRDAERRADDAVAASDGTPGDAELVAHWWAHRNDAVGEYQKVMVGEGLLGPHGVVDTMEVSGTWTNLRSLYHSMKDALEREAQFVGCHISHIYPDGACLYFTMGSAFENEDAARTGHRCWWDAGMAACLYAGGSISHHHGIGRLKAKWLPEELGGWWEVLRSIKSAIDPNGIMNPGALGL